MSARSMGEAIGKRATTEPPPADPPSADARAWIQPPKIKHTVRGYSDDCELLEIILPAEFDTVTLAE